VADLGRGCTTIVATSRDVIRRAVLAPDGATIYEFRVGRHDRADLGVWRRSPGSDDAQQVLEPIAADPAFGITWTTDLAWSTDGQKLAVRGACPGFPCPIAAVDLRDGTTRVLVDAAGLATLIVGEDGQTVVVHESDASGGALRTVSLDGVTTQVFTAPDGLRPISGLGGSGADLPAGWMVLGPDGRLPAMPGKDARAHHLADGQTLRLDEVLP